MTLKGVVPSGCCPWGGVVLGQWSLWEVVVLGGCAPPGTRKASSMHPTGMLSCS